MSINQPYIQLLWASCFSYYDKQQSLLYVVPRSLLGISVRRVQREMYTRVLRVEIYILGMGGLI